MSTTNEKKYSREYYSKNKKYREEKIDKTSLEHKKDSKSYNKYAREYYGKNPKYKKYKIEYAKRYQKTHK